MNIHKGCLLYKYTSCPSQDMDRRFAREECGCKNQVRKVGIPTMPLINPHRCMAVSTDMYARGRIRDY